MHIAASCCLPLHPRPIPRPRPCPCLPPPHVDKRIAVHPRHPQAARSALQRFSLRALLLPRVCRPQHQQIGGGLGEGAVQARHRLLEVRCQGGTCRRGAEGRTGGLGWKCGSKEREGDAARCHGYALSWAPLCSSPRSGLPASPCCLLPAYHPCPTLTLCLPTCVLQQPTQRLDDAARTVQVHAQPGKEAAGRRRPRRQQRPRLLRPKRQLHGWGRGGRSTVLGPKHVPAAGSEPPSAARQCTRTMRARPPALLCACPAPTPPLACCLARAQASTHSGFTMGSPRTTAYRNLGVRRRSRSETTAVTAGCSVVSWRAPTDRRRAAGEGCRQRPDMEWGCA